MSHDEVQRKREQRRIKKEQAKVVAARKEWKKTRPDPRLPQAITMVYHRQTTGRCSYEGACDHEARVSLSWRFLHRGKIKTAKREWCKHHARFFARKHWPTAGAA